MRVIQRLNDKQYVILGACRVERGPKKAGQEIAVLLREPDEAPDRSKRRFARYRCIEIRTAEGSLETVVLYNPAGPSFTLLPGWKLADRVSIESFGADPRAQPAVPAPVAAMHLVLRRRARSLMEILRGPQGGGLEAAG